MVPSRASGIVTRVQRSASVAAQQQSVPYTTEKLPRTHFTRANKTPSGFGFDQNRLFAGHPDPVPSARDEQKKRESKVGNLGWDQINLERDVHYCQ